LASCSKDPIVLEQDVDESGPNLPETPYNYSEIDFPGHFYTNGFIGTFQTSLNLVDNTPEDNQVTDEGATLGRVLFYDKNLSKNRTISCASCHQQAHGFSDPDVFSIGFEGGATGRHSMGLTNAAYYGRGNFFWDERASSLEEQVLMPIQDQIEMGLTLDTLIQRVNQLPYYASLFEASFGDPIADSETIAKALAQFVRSMVSYRSKYDEGRALVESQYDLFPNFTELENLGKNIFLGPMDQGGKGCIDCHSTEGFVNISVGPLSNGLDARVDALDLGHFGVTGDLNHLNTFKTPSLKNIAVRAPFMHDGRFATLEEVIEHYNSGIQDHPNLNFSLLDENGDPVQMNMTEEEKLALKLFMETLTDEPMLMDVKFSDPF
jgi:cytochrome c peroxidase